jgi:hypothetical protein
VRACVFCWSAPTESLNSCPGAWFLTCVHLRLSPYFHMPVHTKVWLGCAQALPHWLVQVFPKHSAVSWQHGECFACLAVQSQRPLVQTLCTVLTLMLCHGVLCCAVLLRR